MGRWPKSDRADLPALRKSNTHIYMYVNVSKERGGKLQAEPCADTFSLFPLVGIGAIGVLFALVLVLFLLLLLLPPLPPPPPSSSPCCTCSSQSRAPMFDALRANQSSTIRPALRLPPSSHARRKIPISASSIEEDFFFLVLVLGKRRRGRRREREKKKKSK